jgi:TPR repeat protein
LLLQPPASQTEATGIGAAAGLASEKTDVETAGLAKEVAAAEEQQKQLAAQAERERLLSLQEDQGAAEAGNIDAQFRVGIAYMTGRGVPRDDPQAIAWFRKAAAGGHEGAKLQLQYQYLEPPR